MLVSIEGGQGRMILEKYKALADYVESGIEGIRRTGLKVLALRDRYVKLLMPLQGNINHVGIMYAGSLFTIGEVVGGAIFGASFNMGQYYPLVKEVHIRFRRPALTDITLEAELGEGQVALILDEMEAKGKADFTLDLELRDANQEVVSTVQGTWQGRKMTPELLALLSRASG
jgi:acyl-coenzyme A thioesterase PaaI-like protein